MINLLRLFQKRSFVLSSQHENQNVATIGTLLDQFMLKELCHETAHARELRVNLKRLAQLFQVSRGDRHSEFIALNLGHPRIFFAFSGFVT